MAEYASQKSLLKERHSTFTNEGQLVEVVIPSHYVEVFKEYMQV
jgi:hypothetical protein